MKYCDQAEVDKTHSTFVPLNDDPQQRVLSEVTRAAQSGDPMLVTKLKKLKEIVANLRNFTLSHKLCELVALNLTDLEFVKIVNKKYPSLLPFKNGMVIDLKTLQVRKTTNY